MLSLTGKNIEVKMQGKKSNTKWHKNDNKNIPIGGMCNA